MFGCPTSHVGSNLDCPREEDAGFHYRLHLLPLLRVSVGVSHSETHGLPEPNRHLDCC